MSAQENVDVVLWLTAAVKRTCAATLYVVGVCLNRIGTLECIALKYMWEVRCEAMPALIEKFRAEVDEIRNEMSRIRRRKSMLRNALFSFPPAVEPPSAVYLDLN